MKSKFKFAILYKCFTVTLPNCMFPMSVGLYK